MQPETSQVNQFIKKIDPNSPKDAPVKENKFQKMESVVFPSILTDQMNHEQVESMITFAVDQILGLESALGRNIIQVGNNGEPDWWREGRSNTGTIENTARSFFGKRQLCSLTYHNRVEWRAYVLGGLWAESNRTLPIARRGTRQMCARAISTFFSVEPWVKASPTNKPDGSVSVGDSEVGVAGERFFQFKSKEARLKEVAERAVERAFVVGECVVKVRQATKYNYFKTSQAILVNEQGKVILGKDGDYIVEGMDQFVYKQRGIVDEESGEAMADDEGNEMTEPDVEKGLFLERDSETMIPPNSRFEWRKGVTRKHTSYSGPLAELVPMTDFLCSQTEIDIQTAPFIAQLVSVSPFDIVATFGQEQLAGITDNKQKVTTMASYIKLLTEMESDGPSPKTSGDMLRSDLGEQTSDGIIRTFGNSRSEVVECYMEYDADGDGSPEQVFLVLDRKRRKIIFCDYLENITADKKRPFSVLTVNKVDGRWHGVGMIEQMEHLQNSVDLWYNRASFSSSSTGITTFFNPGNVTEGDRYAAGGMSLPFNTGEVYHLKPGKLAADTLQYIVVPEVKMKEFLEFMNLNMQMASNEAAVLGTNDMQAAGLDTTKTATGVRDSAAKGDEMFKLVTSHLDSGINDLVQKFAATLFHFMDDQEAYEWSEGDVRITGLLKKTDVRRIKYFFSLTLTGGKNESINAAMTIALPQVMAWAQQPWQMMAASLPLVEAQMKALLIENAPAILRDMVSAKQQIEQMQMQAMQAQAQAESGAQDQALQAKQQETQMDMDAKQQEHGMNMQIAQDEHSMNMQTKQQEMALKQADRKEQAKVKAKAKPPARKAG